MRQTKNCEVCGKEFNAKNAKTRFCSMECFKNSYSILDNHPNAGRPKITTKCGGCGIVFISRRKNRKFCSMKCTAKNRSFTEEGKLAASKLRSDTCKRVNPVKGRKKPWIGQNLGKVRTDETKKKLSNIAKEQWENGQFNEWVKKRREVPLRGEAHFNYKNGNGRLREKLYHLFEYKDWRTSVFKRDKYTCQECGKTGKGLEVHHKKPVRDILRENGITDHLQAAQCKELFDINNGITLCEICHSNQDEYRKRRIKKHEK